MSTFATAPFYDYRRAAADEAEAWALLHERSLRELRWRVQGETDTEPEPQGLVSLDDFMEQWKRDVRAQYADVIPLHGHSVKVPEESV